jgi:hypothetical protein
MVDQDLFGDVKTESSGVLRFIGALYNQPL